MANPQRGEVDIEVNGRTYTLALDLNALSAMQAVIRPHDPESVEMGLIFEKVARFNPMYTRAFVWALLQRYHKTVTLEQASDLVVDAGGVQEFFENTLGKKMQVLAQASQPDAPDLGVVKEAEVNGRPPRAALGGTGSGSTSKRGKSGSVAMSSGV